MGMTASLRVARSGGDTEFRAFASDSKGTGCGISDEQIVWACGNCNSTVISFAGTPREREVTDGDEIRNRSIPFNLYRKRVLHGRWSI
jgi:hypothetical protein